jgi:hypothetical protein
MTCKCTCGGCDCPQFKVTLFPNAGAAAAGNVIDWGYGNAVAGAQPQQVIIRYDANGCAPACPPLLGGGWRIVP